MRSLWEGESLAKTVVDFGGFGQLRLVHSFDLGAEQDMVDRQADLLADVAGHDVIVAGQDLDSHVMLVELAQRLGGGRFGRVQEGQVAQAGSGPIHPGSV